MNIFPTNADSFLPCTLKTADHRITGGCGLARKAGCSRGNSNTGISTFPGLDLDFFINIMLGPQEHAFSQADLWH